MPSVSLPAARRQSWTAHRDREDLGFTLTEVLVALLITVIAVMGLAHTFGLGRGLIDRYAAERDAMGVAQSRMEWLRMESMKNLTTPDLDPTVAHPTTTVALNGQIPAQETWTVAWVHDPMGAGPQDYKRVTVTVTWVQGGLADQTQLSSVFLAR